MIGENALCHRQDALPAEVLRKATCLWLPGVHCRPPISRHFLCDAECKRRRNALLHIGPAEHPVSQFQNRYRGKGGRVYWLSWVWVSEDALVYCNGRDVIAGRAPDAELAPADLDQLWDLSPDLLTSADGRLLRVNPSWIRALDYDENWLLTQSYGEIPHPEELGLTSALLNEMKSKQRSVRPEARLRADGAWCSFFWTLSPEPGGQRLYGIGRDVTGERTQSIALAVRTAEHDQLWTLSAICWPCLLLWKNAGGRPAWTRLASVSRSS